MTKWLQEFWRTKPIVVMMMLVFVSNLVVGCGPASPEFSYMVRVRAEDTDEAIPGAEVRIEVFGKAPLSDMTDADGYARIFIDSSYSRQPGKLIVKATGYKGCEKHIDLTESALPKIILLQKESVAESPSPTTTPTTPIATPEPPTSTLTPTPIPTPVFIESPRDLNLREAPSLRNRVKNVIPKGSLFRIVMSYDEDKPREWLLVEAENGLRGWTLLDEEIFEETPVPTGEKFTPTVSSTIVPSVEVPATPIALPPPTLISPKTFDDVTFHGNVVLVWDWDGALEKGWFYSVRVGQDAKTGHPEEPTPCFHYQFSFAKVYEGDLESCEPDRYYWEVVVAARNEEFVRESTSTEYISEEVKEFMEISVVSTREYFDYACPEPAPTDTSTPAPTDTPSPSPRPTSTATSTATTAPTPTLTPTPTPDAVVNVNAHLRSGPGTDHDRMRTIWEGDPLEVVGKNLAGNWLKVICSDGKKGWVAVSCVEMNIPLADVPVVYFPPTPTLTCTPTLTPTATPLLAPTLLLPEDEGRFSEHYVLLTWEWIRPLGEDEYFSVRIRPEGDPEACWHPHTKTTQYIGAPAGCESGKHYWSVIVAREDPESPTGWREISKVSEERWFDFFRPD